MDRRVNIRICFHRRSDLVALLSLAVLTATFLGYLAWGHREVAASGSQAPAAVYTNLRGYYLTQNSYDGSETLAACTQGYHFASLWEIMDTSNLRYNTDLGYTQADSGQGPPTYHGWVRTGYSSYASGTPGWANCSAWTSSSSSDSGSYAFLPNNWTAGDEDFLAWAIAVGSCSGSRRVWCVANEVGGEIYLPVVLRNF